MLGLDFNQSKRLGLRIDTIVKKNYSIFLERRFISSYLCVPFGIKSEVSVK